MYLHANYCKGLAELKRFLKKIKPEEFITVSAHKSGYETYHTVIWKSNQEHDFR